MSQQRFSILVAMTLNRTIGINNTLPWRCPDDLKHFKALTMGHTIIMGRKTFDSIGRPLPGRTTVVVTRNREFHISAAVADIHRDQAPPSMVTPGKCIIAPSLNAAFDACPADTESFIVGGAEIYAQAMPSVDTMYITEIQQNIDGDAHFPKVNPTEWQEIDRERHIQHLPQSLEFHFVTYRRHPYRPPIVDIS